MVVEKTDRQKLADAQRKIRRRGVEIGVLKRRAKRLEDAEILMKRHERRWMELQAENDTLREWHVQQSTGIAKLKEELRKAVEERDRQEKCFSRMAGLADKLEGNVEYLKSCLISAWGNVDELRSQLAGSQAMPDGRTAREHARDMIMSDDECTD